MTIRMNPAHDTVSPPGCINNRETAPPGQVREVDANGVTKGFDRYPWLKTSTEEKAPYQQSPSKGALSPAKRLGDIIDGVVARSSERPSNQLQAARHMAALIRLQRQVGGGLPTQDVDEFLAAFPEPT